jgi:hypothetical protein
MGTIWKKKKIKKRKKQKNERKALTLTGLLMEGLYRGLCYECCSVTCERT